MGSYVQGLGKNSITGMCYHPSLGMCINVWANERNSVLCLCLLLPSTLNQYLICCCCLCYFETIVHSVVPMIHTYTRMALNPQWSSFLCLQSGWIKGMCCHILLVLGVLLNRDLCTPAWQGTRYVTQAGLEFMILLYFPNGWDWAVDTTLGSKSNYLKHKTMSPLRMLASYWKGLAKGSLAVLILLLLLSRKDQKIKS